MTPGEEQTLARLVGRVEGKLDTLTEQVNRIIVGLDGKADAPRVDRLEDRIGSLETSRTRTGARSDLLKGGFGAALALVGLFISNGGHI